MGRIRINFNMQIQEAVKASFCILGQELKDNNKVNNSQKNLYLLQQSD